jgi:hypothetical protein
MEFISRTKPDSATEQSESGNRCVDGMADRSSLGKLMIPSRVIVAIEAA